MSIRINLFANFSGSIWNTFIAIIAIPIYINYLGVEAYGLIGFYTLLLSLFQILDMGLSTTMQREMVIFSKSSERNFEMKDFARTLELLCWSIGLVVGILILICSGLIGNHLSQSSSFESNELSQVVMLLAFLIFARWPMGFYLGGFIGFEKHLRFNILNSVIESSKVLISIVAMLLFGKNIHVFFTAQILVTALGTIMFLLSFWSMMPKGKKAKFNINHILRVKLFILSLGGTNIIGLLISNMDKLILVNILSLKDFGYYTIAASMAVTLLKLTYPFMQTISPRLIHIVKFSKKSEIIKNYHHFAQYLSVLIIPALVCGAFFSYELLLMWTSNLELSEKVWPIATLLFCGVGCYSLYTLPYTFQLADGNAKKLMLINAIAACVMIPSLFIFVHFFKIFGAALVFFLINLGYLCFGGLSILYRLFKIRIADYYFKDIGRVAVVAVITAGSFRYLMDFIEPISTTFVTGLLMLVIGGITFTLSVLISPYPRKRALAIVGGYFKRRL